MNAVCQREAAFLRPDLIWAQVRRPAAGESRPILFLDRDGVVVEEVNYLHRVEDVRFIAGVAETVALARRAGWRVAMVTNQAGIGRGYYDWDEFAAVNAFILDQLDAQGAFVDAVFAAPHHPDGLPPYAAADHPMRKPNPGMLLAAAAALAGHLAESVIVGDNAADLLAGRRAGLLRGFHVLTGHGGRYRAESEALAGPDFTVSVVADAGDRLLRALWNENGER